MRCDEKKKKKVFVETLLVVTHLADLLSALIQKRKNRYSFVGSCPVSTVFSSCMVYRERTNNNHKVVAERWLLQEEESYKVPLSEYCLKYSTILMMSDNEEDLDDFPTFSTENIKHYIQGRSPSGPNSAPQEFSILNSTTWPL